MEHRFERCGVMPVSRRQVHDHGTPLPIRPDMELGCEPTPASPHRLLPATARSNAMLVYTHARAIDKVHRPIQHAALICLPEER